MQNREKINNKNNLVVEDELIPFELYKNYLKGIIDEKNILYAEDASGALTTLENEHIDLVIIDLLMPKTDGFETLIQIRKNKKRKDLPIIIITSYRLNKEQKERLDKNVIGCFSKIYLKEEQLTELICENLFKSGKSVSGFSKIHKKNSIFKEL